MPTIVGGRGVYLVDDLGRDLLDACSGPFLASLGQGNERVLAAMHDQGRRLTYTYSRTTRHAANAELTQRLVGLAGHGFDRVHLTSGGSEAVEMALKMLRVNAVAMGQPRRHRVLSLLPGYHGATVQTLGLNGDLAAPELWGPMTVSAEKVPAPLTFRAVSAEEAAAESLAALDVAIDSIGPEEVLAFVMEPIGGQASGVNVPHPSFARGARALCDRHGIALVFDEIVTAFRTGTFLAAHHDLGALPDLVVLAKGLGAGYAPLGAVLARSSFVDPMADSGGFVVSHSYDACPMACAAGSAVLDEIIDGDLIAHADRIGQHIRTGLEDLAKASPLIGDVRGRGLLQAIELVREKSSAAKFPADVDPGGLLVQRGLDHGLLLYSRRQNGGRFGDWLLIAPPLITDRSTAESLVERLDATLASAVDELCAT
jgi:adenosylmethionine-8-amino-7-oxononanoate aminotransferase